MKKCLAICIYLLLITAFLRFDIRLLFDARQLFLVVFGAALLYFPALGIKQRKPHFDRELFGQNSLWASIIQTFVLLFVVLSEGQSREKMMVQVAMACRPLLYGFCLWVVFSKDSLDMSDNRKEQDIVEEPKFIADITGAGKAAADDIELKTKTIADITGTGEAAADMEKKASATADITRAGKTAADIEKAANAIADISGTGNTTADIEKKANAIADISETGKATADIATETNATAEIAGENRTTKNIAKKSKPATDIHPSAPQSNEVLPQNHNRAARERLASLGLTRREIEVALLAAANLSNAEIATELFISETTVKKHLSNIYGKLGISKRGQIGELCKGERTWN